MVIIISFIVGAWFGFFMMGVFSARAYNRGWSDGLESAERLRR